MRRLVVLASCLVVLLIGLPASAGELEDHLEERANLRLRGEQLISCSGENGPDTSLLHIEMADGSAVSRLESDSGESLVVPVAVPGLWELAERYSARLVGQVMYLGAPADRFEITDGSLKRVEIVFDQATSVMVSATTFDSDGSEICEARMLSWQLDSSVALKSTGSVDSGLVPLGSRSTIADKIAGFTLAGTGQTDSYLVGRYVDGIFTFTLTVFDDVVKLTELENPHSERVGRRQYLVDNLPFGRSLHYWTVGAETYLVVGNLPADLTAEVLAELPAPRALGLWERLKSLFG